MFLAPASLPSDGPTRAGLAGAAALGVALNAALHWIERVRHRRVLQALHDLAHTLRESRHGVETLDVACRQIAVLLDCQAVLIQVADSSGEYYVAGNWGATAAWLAERGLTHTEKHPLALRRLDGKLRLQEGERAYLKGILGPKRAESAVALPLRAPGKLDAVLVGVYARGRFLSAEAREGFRLAATFVRTWLLHSASLKSLLAEARTDALTGLGTRRLFEDHYERAVGRMRRGHGKLTLVMIDVDGLKGINDTWGHRAGDEVLRMFGRLLQDLRSGDVPVRFGGDEFVILMPDTDRTQAEVVAARLKERLARLNSLDIFPFPVRASVGIQEVTPEADDALALADSAMYQEKRAKRSGNPGRVAQREGARGRGSEGEMGQQPASNQPELQSETRNPKSEIDEPVRYRYGSGGR